MAAPKKHTKVTLKKENRRTKMKKRILLENFYQNLGNISYLCQQIKISRKTYYEWLKKDAVFAEEIYLQEEALIDYGESQLFKLMNSDNPAAVIFFLKTKGKDRGYVERQEMDHQGRIHAITESKLTIIHTKEEDPKIIEEIEKELKEG